ncbi:GNAT family N-acetyltransferase [Mesorhizobium sp. M2A.F.Ca.ET.067.02.1.1]|uniref:GNAT family N-acetyltransferase n=1 Tax=Mesorhizobium sp. M2A.F.Ca.ET.067.02.1.1 TaxID=2496749 RepID=UPI001FDFA1E7|nr:GNAT family N-acetyltransferase [Mesorhizobium sp. M2A.F.Ca.ET.067.02.1.1]
MAGQELQYRTATRDDIERISALMGLAIAELQKPFLDDAQIESSRAIMGLDTQLIDDGTYFVVTCAGALAGCGGWSRRSTMYGGDKTPGRSAALLDPARDAARVRAMYTHPDFVRRGVGRLILSLCEDVARKEASGVSSSARRWPESRSTGHAATSRARGSSTTPAARRCRS